MDEGHSAAGVVGELAHVEKITWVLLICQLNALVLFGSVLLVLKKKII